MLAHSLAIASDLVTADMVEAIEFPHLTQKYGVMGVPRSVINDKVHQEGAAPEPGTFRVAKLREDARVRLPEFLVASEAVNLSSTKKLFGVSRVQ